MNEIPEPSQQREIAPRMVSTALAIPEVTARADSMRMCSVMATDVVLLASVDIESAIPAQREIIVQPV